MKNKKKLMKNKKQGYLKKLENQDKNIGNNLSFEILKIRKIKVVYKEN